MAIETTAVLEIGTGTVQVMVGEVLADGSVSVVGHGETVSRGIRKGEIVDRKIVIEDVRDALKKAEENMRGSIHSIHLLTSGGGTESKISTGTLRLVDPNDNRRVEVSEDDVAELVEISRRIALPESRIRLHTLKQFFQVDDLVDLAGPVGMEGEELRLDMLTLHGKRSTVDNLHKIVEDVPVQCNDAVFSGLCSAMAVLSDEQKKAGALVIDVGSGTTDFVLFYDGVVRFAASFGVGGDHVTNDVSVGLNIPVTQAEQHKIKDGNALTNLMERDHNISIPAQQGFPSKMVRAVMLNIIINARMEEIFMMVKTAVDQACPNTPLGAGVLLTGGGAFLTGARDLGQKVFNVTCSYGKPFDVHGLPAAKDAPRYAAPVGCIRYVASLRSPKVKQSIREAICNFFIGGPRG